MCQCPVVETVEIIIWFWHPMFSRFFNQILNFDLFWWVWIQSADCVRTCYLHLAPNSNWRCETHKCKLSQFEFYVKRKHYSSGNMPPLVKIEHIMLSCQIFLLFTIVAWFKLDWLNATQWTERLICTVVRESPNLFEFNQRDELVMIWQKH